MVTGILGVWVWRGAVLFLPSLLIWAIIFACLVHCWNIFMGPELPCWEHWDLLRQSKCKSACEVLLDRANFIYNFNIISGNKTLWWHSMGSGPCPLWVGGDESSCDKFYSDTFTMGPLTASLGIFLDTCLSMNCSCINFFCKVKLMVSWFSPPLSNVNCFC